MISFSALKPAAVHWPAHDVSTEAAIRESLRRIRKHTLLYLHLLRDPHVPTRPKVWLMGTFILLFNPISLILSVPIISFIEDMAVAMVVSKLFLKKVPADVLASHKQALGM